MSTEKDLLQVIRSNPYSAEPWMVYCDWLEENGSDRAGLIRSELIHRIPYSLHEFDAFSGWVEQALNADPNQVVKHKVAKNYVNDMDQVCPDKVLRNLQRNLDGRFPLKRRAVLAAYGNAPWTMKRQNCLVVCTPERRRAEPRINVRIESVILRNQAQNWTNATWLWNKSISEPEQIVDAQSVQLEHASAAVEELLEKPSLTSAQRCKLAIHLLDLLRFKEAFELYEIDWDPALTEALCQVPFVPENPLVDGKAARLARENQPSPSSKNLNSWSVANNQLKYNLSHAAAIRSELWRAAPWKIKSTIDALFKYRKHRLKSQRETKLRLFALPKQPQQSKLSVMVGCDKEGKNHRVWAEFTAANDRLALPEWQRDFWFDMQRVGRLSDSARTSSQTK